MGESCEIECDTDGDQFMCSDFTCINKTMLCDGHMQCSNDESYCEGVYIISNYYYSCLSFAASWALDCCFRKKTSSIVMCSDNNNGNQDIFKMLKYVKGLIFILRNSP